MWLRPQPSIPCSRTCSLHPSHISRGSGPGADRSVPRMPQPQSPEPCTNTMPSAAPKPCNHPGCGVLVKDGGARCPKHPGGMVARFGAIGRASRHDRGYGSDWDKTRKRILIRDCGMCQSCAKQGIVRLACDVDHIVPKAEGGTDEECNLQSLCKSCHSEKTKQESARGVQRGWGKSQH